MVPGGAGQGRADHTFVRAIGECRELIFKTENQRGGHYSSFLGVARRLHSSSSLLLWESIFGMIQKLF